MIRWPGRRPIVDSPTRGRAPARARRRRRGAACWSATRTVISFVMLAIGSRASASRLGEDLAGRPRSSTRYALAVDRRWRGARPERRAGGARRRARREHEQADGLTARGSCPDLERRRVDRRVQRSSASTVVPLRRDRAERVAARDGVRLPGGAALPRPWSPSAARRRRRCRGVAAVAARRRAAGGRAARGDAGRADEQDGDRRREEERERVRRRGRAPDAGARPSTSRRRPRPRRAAASPRRRPRRASRARGRSGRRRSPSATRRRARSPARS